MENKLTIKELAPYLPYEIGVAKEGFATQYFKVNAFLNVYDAIILDDFKPLLRPLSDLTSEIKHKGEKFVPAELLNEEIPNSPNYDWLKDTYTKKDLSHSIIEWCVMDKLISWHFDVFGLIERGLALPIKN